MMTRIQSGLVLAAVLAMISVFVVGCDSMTDYPRSEQPTDRSDTYKTGSGTYGGTDSNYNPSDSNSGSPVMPPGTSSYSGSSVGGANTGGSPSTGATTTGPGTEGR
jgi:hypothetical protein